MKIAELHEKYTFKGIFDAIYFSRDDVPCQDQYIAGMLYSVKVLCLETGAKCPDWWYASRNRLNCLSNEGVWLLGFDLGGF